MNGAALDGRREKALRAELLRRAAALLGGDGQDRPAGEIAGAIIGVAARIGEEVTRRLDRVPDKQTDNFFNAMGIGRDPARPSRLPVAFRLADPAPDGLVAPASTRLMAEGETESVVFETSRAIALVPGSIAALVGIDATDDRIFLPPEGVVGAGLLREPAIERTLPSGAGAGEDKLQISLATGLAVGTILRIGTAADASQHRVVELEGDLATIDPPLERTFGAGTPVTVVTDFAPFAGQRNRQSHALYLGHETLLNVPSALSITVTGVEGLPEATEWSWWGGDDPPDWHRLNPVSSGDRLTLAKDEGQPLKKAIRGRETLWLRARLPGPSRGAIEARDIRLSVAGEGICAKEHTERCSEADSPMEVEFEAIANTTPVVPNSPFHPFGREPRLFDSFYVGCAEAFSKPGAEVSLCFKFAGPELGPLAMVAGGALVQVFGVGEDGLLYRAQFGRDPPRLTTIALRRDKTGGALSGRARVAARLAGDRVLVAIAGQGTIYFGQLPFEGPLDPGVIDWKSLPSEEDRSARFDQIAIVMEGGAPVVLAQAGTRVLSWKDPAGALGTVLGYRELVPLQGADAALLIGTEGADTVIAVRGLGQASSLKLKRDALPAFDLAAWAVPPPMPADAAWVPDTIFLAGYETASGKASLRVVRIDRSERTVTEVETLAKDALPGQAQAMPQRWPIAFQPPPPPASPRPDGPPVAPTIVLASATPVRFVWRGGGYKQTAAPPPIGISDNPHRQFVSAPGWIAVHHSHLGLLYRPGGADGAWADEFLLDVLPEGLEIAEEVPGDRPLYAAPDRSPRGNGFEILQSDIADPPGRALLRPSPGPRPSSAASFFVEAGKADGNVEIKDEIVRLVDAAAFGAWTAAVDHAKTLETALLQLEADLEARRTAASEKFAEAAPAKAVYTADETALGQARGEVVAARQEAAEASQRLGQMTADRVKAEVDLAAWEPPATEKTRTGLERLVTETKAEERKALRAALAAGWNTKPFLHAAAAAQKKRDDSHRAWRLLAEPAETLAGEVAALETKLRQDRQKWESAVATAKRKEDISVRLEGTMVDILAFGEGQIPNPHQIWHLQRPDADAQWWNRPAGFPPQGMPPEGKALRYRILSWKRDCPVQQALRVLNSQQLEARIHGLGPAKPLRFDTQPNVPVPPFERFTRAAAGELPAQEVATIPAPRELFEDDSALLTTATEEWRRLGPAQPPNPALSWEYWNGRSWWALDGAGLVDATSNLLVDGGLFFIVPADFAATEVGGRDNHWIRARLVGGDYGEAQVTVKSTPVDEETHQTVERDMTTIRAPYVTSLQLGFCARTEVPPEIVLTEDSLGAIDQTSANLAGLPVTIFTPVGNVMNGEQEEPATFRRGLMIGFESPVRGDPVSLYVDAAPGDVARELIAETLRDGQFQKVGVRDETYGLSEPGTIQLSLNAAPDQTDLFDAAAYWVRLRPAADASSWSPRIKGVYLNAVPARSVETREMESLGHSSGVPGQALRLAEAPVAPDSLELRVREPLGEEDLLLGGLDVLKMAGTMPGPWVRWEEVDSLGDLDGPARGFVLDAETGRIQFGDGRHGAIPPLGAELLAVRYRHVAGAAGNAVAAGAALQLVSPLASVERVTALDAAAGGSDVETAEEARRRASAKLRHGNRILTLADLEDYVRACSPTIAQARAANLQGAVRVVVATRGAEPRPAPGMLRELEQAVRATAGYGIARRQGLSLVPPRLLPLRVQLALDPDDPDRFVEMADAAEAALIDLFDPATGGFDRQGWPIGRLPTRSDIAAALEAVSIPGVASIVALLRADRKPAAALPASLPADVLVRLDPNDIVAERRREAAA